jgi:hypothetical protein
VDFIVIEYIEGKPLDALIPPHGMQPAQALRHASDMLVENFR